MTDRWLDMVDANEAGRRIFFRPGVPRPEDGPVNGVDIFLGTQGPFRQLIENYSAVAWMLLRRFRAEVTSSAPDERLEELLQKAESYMKDVPPDDSDLASDLVVCPRMRLDGRLIRTTILEARFGPSRELTQDELRVHLVIPADEEAAAFFREQASAAEHGQQTVPKRRLMTGHRTDQASKTVLYSLLNECKQSPEQGELHGFGAASKVGTLFLLCFSMAPWACTADLGVDTPEVAVRCQNDGQCPQGSACDIIAGLCVAITKQCLSFARVCGHPTRSHHGLFRPAGERPRRDEVSFHPLLVFGGSEEPIAVTA